MQSDQDIYTLTRLVRFVKTTRNCRTWWTVGLSNIAIDAPRRVTSGCFQSGDI